MFNVSDVEERARDGHLFSHVTSVVHSNMTLYGSGPEKGRALKRGGTDQGFGPLIYRPLEGGVQYPVFKFQNWEYPVSKFRSIEYPNFRFSLYLS